MALSEAQIVRYSRQILLQSVGGIGQEKLLASGVQVRGRSQAVATAAAYLCAGGTHVQGTGEVTSAQRGFLFSPSDVGTLAWSSAVKALNPEALGGRCEGLISELPFSFDGVGPWVALGGEQSSGVLVQRSGAGCISCFEQWISGLGPPPDGALASLLGAFAAVVFQRAVLGLEPATLRAWRLSSTGDLVDHRGALCSRHA